MELEQYLYTNRIKQSEAAKELGLLRGTFNNIVKKRYKCREDLALIISKWSGYAVPASSIMTPRKQAKKCSECGRLHYVKG